ncbi:MAG: hypothetical protein D3903_18320, partial [Candidatus Electrothrix sp. GM3_4]|nr:hypothetical protein [Candidatus Electrothrix sp. GM3_4]
MTEQVMAKKGVSLKQVLLIVVGAMILTALLTFFAIKIWLFPSPFTPVELSQQEEQRLEQKISQFDTVADAPRSHDSNGSAAANTRPSRSAAQRERPSCFPMVSVGKYPGSRGIQSV